VEKLLTEALEEFGRMESGYILLVRSLLLKLVILVGREYSRRGGNERDGALLSRHSRAIWEAVAYIDGKCHEKLTVNALAERFHFSPSYFSYLFKNVTSRSFMEYLTGARLSRAMELLRTTEMTVADISATSGFGDTASFHRSFRARTGTTPNQYRRGAVTATASDNTIIAG
jgi:transcriptional regulator GlxA family with amidase domain